MKSSCRQSMSISNTSRPARGEWIEIRISYPRKRRVQSRPARGEWIEIARLVVFFCTAIGLAPRGASGLKSHCRQLARRTAGSRPARGEWIEISWLMRSAISRACLAPRGASGLKYTCAHRRRYTRSLAPRGASGLKFAWRHKIARVRKSRPARGEWIEIPSRRSSSDRRSVSPREWRVD